VYTRGKFDFGNHTDPATWYDTALGLCKGKLETRRFDVLSHPALNSGKSFEMTLFAVSRSVYFGVKYFSRITPLEST